MPDLKPIYKRPDTPLAETPDPRMSYTDSWQKTKNVQDANEKKGKTTPGIEVKDGVAKAKPYEKKYIPASDKRTNAVITDGKNNIINSSKEGSKKSISNLRNTYVKDSTETMNRRNNNANYYNLTSGSKKQLTNLDKKSLLKTGKARLS